MTLETAAQLIGCYFHQDMFDDYGSEESTLLNMLAEADRDSLVRCSVELRQLLVEPLNDDDLERIIRDELGCYYCPPGAGVSYRVWLESVVSTLDQRISDTV